MFSYPSSPEESEDLYEFLKEDPRTLMMQLQELANHQSSERRDESTELVTICDYVEEATPSGDIGESVKLKKQK